MKNNTFKIKTAIKGKAIVVALEEDFTNRIMKQDNKATLAMCKILSDKVKDGFEHIYIAPHDETILSMDGYALFNSIIESDVAGDYLMKCVKYKGRTIVTVHPELINEITLGDSPVNPRTHLYCVHTDSGFDFKQEYVELTHLLNNMETGYVETYQTQTSVEQTPVVPSSGTTKPVEKPSLMVQA